MKRPPIPERVKRACIWGNMTKNRGKLLCAETGKEIDGYELIFGRRVHFDHNPPLALRDRVGDKFKPPANAPGYIDVVSVEGHKIRTNKKRGLQRGDQTAIAHSRKVRRSNGLEPTKDTVKERAKAYRRERYLKAKAMKRKRCSDCGKNWADPPGDLCPGCWAYREHQS